MTLTMQEWRAQHLWRMWTAVAFLTAALIAATVHLAVASGHYHVVGVGHGFVHGASNTDGSFHSRVDASPTTPRSCQIDSIWNTGGYATLTYGDVYTTCNLWSHSIWQSATECQYRADVYNSDNFGWHVHRPVNYCA